MCIRDRIQTDNHTILFDLGYNAEEQDPSPLQQNMAKFGITLDSIDMIVISHNHFDHVGGHRWMDANTFSLANVQADLGTKKIFTPIDTVSYTHLTLPTSDLV